MPIYMYVDLSSYKREGGPAAIISERVSSWYEVFGGDLEKDCVG
jgi:hypothetical protein